MEYWLLVANTPQGPFPEEVLESKIRTLELGADALVCPVGGSSWSRIRDVSTLAGYLASVPPPPPRGAAAPGIYGYTAADGTIPAGQKPLNVTMLVAAIILSSCNLGVSLLTAGATETSATVDLLSFCLWAASMTTWLLFHYGLWSYVPPAYRETTPGKAVGFLFIPFYNCYWVFRSCLGLARGLSRLADAQGYPGARINTGLTTAFCSFWIVSFAAMVGTGILGMNATAEGVTALNVANFVVAEAPIFILWLLMVLNQKSVVEAMAQHATSACQPMQSVPS